MVFDVAVNMLLPGSSCIIDRNQVLVIIAQLEIGLVKVFRIVYAVVATLVLGVGLCMCLVWQQIIWGALVGLLGIVMLIALIPMMKGIK